MTIINELLKKLPDPDLKPEYTDLVAFCDYQFREPFDLFCTRNLEEAIKRQKLEDCPYWEHWNKESYEHPCKHFDGKLRLIHKKDKNSKSTVIDFPVKQGVLNIDS